MQLLLFDAQALKPARGEECAGEPAREARTEYDRRYYLEHREQKLAYARAYREEHKEQLRAKRRRRYAVEGEAIRTRQRAWHAKHRDRRNAAQRARRAAQPETFKALALRKEYGLSLDEYQVMLDAQNGVCAICMKPERARNRNGSAKLLAVDHDHRSGAVRGLLCSFCNSALAFIGDDPDVAGRMILYLAHPPAGKSTDG
jgi:hypothetical protein